MEQLWCECRRTCPIHLCLCCWILLTQCSTFTFGLKAGCINAYSALNKAALLHNTIDECELNIRFVTETGIKTRIWMQLSLFLLHLDSPFYTFISQLTVLSVVVELLSSLVTNWVSKMSVYRGNISHPPYWRHNALQKLAD